MVNLTGKVVSLYSMERGEATLQSVRLMSGRRGGKKRFWSKRNKIISPSSFEIRACTQKDLLILIYLAILSVHRSHEHFRCLSIGGWWMITALYSQVCCSTQGTESSSQLFGNNLWSFSFWQHHLWRMWKQYVDVPAEKNPRQTFTIVLNNVSNSFVTLNIFFCPQITQCFNLIYVKSNIFLQSSIKSLWSSKAKHKGAKLFKRQRLNLGHSGDIQNK